MILNFKVKLSAWRAAYEHKIEGVSQAGSGR